MSMITVRNLPEDVHKALKLRAVQNGRSTEAEVREILAAAVKPRVGMGTALAAIGRKLNLTDAEVDAINRVREESRVEPAPLKFDSESAERKRSVP